MRSKETREAPHATRIAGLPSLSTLHHSRKSLALAATFAIVSCGGEAAFAAARQPRSFETNKTQQTQQQQRPQHDSIPGTLVSFEMVSVSGGPSTIDGPGGARTVEVAPFYIGRTEVTWDMYDVFALRLDQRPATGGADAVARPSSPYGAPDYGWGHAGYPAISIARGGAQAFCEWLSAKTGKKYRLPTEAEWVRAAALSTGGTPLTPERLAALAWQRGNADNRTHPVASRQPDALGLYDLFGNAAEWVVSDDGSSVVRGGSFEDVLNNVGPRARAVQSDSWNERDPQLPKSRWWLSDGPFVGFRIVRVQ